MFRTLLTGMEMKLAVVIVKSNMVIILALVQHTKLACPFWIGWAMPEYTRPGTLLSTVLLLMP